MFVSAYPTVQPRAPSQRAWGGGEEVLSRRIALVESAVAMAMVVVPALFSLMKEFGSLVQLPTALRAKGNLPRAMLDVYQLPSGRRRRKRRARSPAVYSAESAMKVMRRPATPPYSVTVISSPAEPLRTSSTRSL